MRPDELFECKALRCKLLARVCVKRQVESEAVRATGRTADLSRHDGKRGTSPEYPSCSTAQCAQGRQVLYTLVESVIAGVKHGDRSDLAQQRRAARAQARVTPPSDHAVPLDVEKLPIPRDDLLDAGPMFLGPRRQKERRP